MIYRLPILTFLLLLTTPLLSAQGEMVGRVVYIEGQVQLGKGSWMKCSLQDTVYSDQQIRTLSNGVAEILWVSGVKTVVDPMSTFRIADLYAKSQSGSTSKVDNVFNRFMRIFESSASPDERQAGGVRRSQVVLDRVYRPDELYWKEEPEVSFDDAAGMYSAGDHLNAIRALKTFIEQHAGSAKLSQAYVMLGLSYLKVNNAIRAKEAFTTFVEQYPGDELVPEIKALMADL